MNEVWVVFRSDGSGEDDELLGAASSLDDIHKMVAGHWVIDDGDPDFAFRPTSYEYAIRVRLNEVRT